MLRRYTDRTRHVTAGARWGAAVARAWGSPVRGGGGARRGAWRRPGALGWFARAAARRIFAAVLSLAVLSLVTEPLIADVHDGDVPAAAASATPAAVSAHGSDVAVAANDRAPDGRPPAGAPVPGHTAHVCHAGHEHVASTSAWTVRAIGTVAVVERASAVDAGRPVSRAIEPPVRPPIA